MFSISNKHEELFDYLVSNAEIFHAGAVIARKACRMSRSSSSICRRSSSSSTRRMRRISRSCRSCQSYCKRLTTHRIPPGPHL